MPSIRNDAAHWFRRAQETRQLAESIGDAEAKSSLLKIAEQYERLAQLAASRGNGNGS
jgi:hypothetical protein